MVSGVEGDDRVGGRSVLAERQRSGAPADSAVGGRRPHERCRTALAAAPRLERGDDLVAPRERVGLDLRVRPRVVRVAFGRENRGRIPRRRGFAGDACDSDSQAEDDQPGGEGPSHARRTLPAVAAGS
jgi:hypothetical protein